MAPRGSNALGGITDPYRYVVHTVVLVLPGTPRHPVYRQSVSCTRAARCSRKKRCPGLNGPVSLRASSTQGTVVLLWLLYLRSAWPGSWIPCQGIQGNCWIDPGTRWIGSGSSIGPEMDCVWLLLTLD